MPLSTRFTLEDVREINRRVMLRNATNEPLSLSDPKMLHHWSFSAAEINQAFALARKRLSDDSYR